MHSIFRIIISLFFILIASPPVSANDLGILLDRVCDLNIGRNGYTLGTALTAAQVKIARQHAAAASAPGTRKFRDNDLYVVTEENTNRVIIVFEHYETASPKKIRDVVGGLFLDFGDPTLTAHDKIIFWAFDENGKISQEKYQSAKKNKAVLTILAAVKLNSSVKITGKNSLGREGRVYYTISSEPVLKLINARDN